MKEKKKKSDIIITIVIVLVVIAFVATIIKVFLGLVNGSDNKTTKETAKQTEIEKIINKNLDQSYPQTPTALVDLYCSITKQLHSKSVTDEEIEGLCQQLRKLFDDELLKNNDYDTQLSDLKEEVASYKKANTTISSYIVEDKDNLTIYVDDDGHDCTKVKIEYSLKSNEIKKEYEQVILRKDDDGNWKIHGWETIGSTISESDE